MTSTWLLLDFDNCQMATEHLAVPSLIAQFNELYAKQIGEELTYEKFTKNFHGQARETLCDSLSKYYGIDINYPLLYEARDWKIMQMLQKTGVEMAGHLVETLESLQKQGYKFAFVSNNAIQRGLTAMRYATNGQGDRLARLFGTAFFEAGDVQKPKPDVYLRAMEQLSVSPQKCYAIEDSVSGVKAAVGAGIRTFGCLVFSNSPQETEQKLIDHGAVACFRHWKDLSHLLDKY